MSALWLRQRRIKLTVLCRVLIMCGAALIIVGFSQAADEGFDAPSAYATIVSGGVLLILSIIHSFRTKRNAIIPPVSLVIDQVGPALITLCYAQRLMRNRTTLFFTIGAFMNSMIFMPANFLLPQFFQGVSIHHPSRTITSDIRLGEGFRLAQVRRGNYPLLPSHLGLCHHLWSDH